MKKLSLFLMMLIASFGIKAQENNLQAILDTANSGYMNYLELIPSAVVHGSSDS